MIFVLFCFNVWYQESKDIWDIRVLIRTRKIIIFVELLDGWLSSKFGLALIFEIKNSLVKKFVVLHRNLHVRLEMLTHHVLWMKEAIKQTSCCDVIIHFRIFSWSQVWICIKHQYFWRGEISFLYSLYDEDNFKLAIFFFLEMGEAFIAMVLPICFLKYTSFSH